MTSSPGEAVVVMRYWRSVGREAFIRSALVLGWHDRRRLAVSLTLFAGAAAMLWLAGDRNQVVQQVQWGGTVIAVGVVLFALIFLANLAVVPAKNDRSQQLTLNEPMWSVDARVGKGLFFYLHVRNSGSTSTFQVIVDSISGFSDAPATPYYAPWFDPFDAVPKDLSERQSQKIAGGGFGNVPLFGLFMYAQGGEHLNLFQIWSARALHHGYHRASDDMYPDITINVRLLADGGTEQRRYRVRGGHPVGIWIEGDVAGSSVQAEMVERFSRNALRAADALNDGSRRVNDKGIFQRQMLAWRSIVVGYLGERGVTASAGMFRADLPEDLTQAEQVARGWAAQLTTWLSESQTAKGALPTDPGIVSQAIHALADYRESLLDLINKVMLHYEWRTGMIGGVVEEAESKAKLDALNADQRSARDDVLLKERALQRLADQLGHESTTGIALDGALKALSQIKTYSQFLNNENEMIRLIRESIAEAVKGIHATEVNP